MSIRIAVLSPVSWRTPPRHYGPWESMVSLLTEQLVRLGMDVTPFATADSQSSGKLVAVCPRPYSEDPSVDPKVAECLHISELFERAAEFDRLTGLLVGKTLSGGFLTLTWRTITLVFTSRFRIDSG